MRGRSSAQPSKPDAPRAGRAQLRDVAALANVSVATASQALRGGPVSETARERVLDAARKLRYVPQASASILRTGRSRMIGMWVLNRPEARELTEECSFFYPVIRGAMEALEGAGYGLRFSAASGDPDDVAEQLATVAASGSPAGFIVIPQWRNFGTYRRTLVNADSAAVTIGDGGVEGPYVSVDNAGGIAALVGHLVEAGHTRIAYLAGPEDHLDAEGRLAAFYQAATQRGLSVPGAWVQRVPFTIAGGQAGLRALLAACDESGDGRPTALLGADDYVAAGAIREAHVAGIDVPGEMSIVGFDDVDVARAMLPGLTTVRQPLRELGRMAAHQLLAVLGGDDVASVELPVELVIRESVVAPRGGSAVR